MSLSTSNIFCPICKKYNCILHYSSKNTPLIDKLNSLLGHFQEPKNDMRTYINPDKTKRTPKTNIEYIESVIDKFDENSKLELGCKNTYDITPTTRQLPVYQESKPTYMSELFKEEIKQKSTSPKHYKPTKPHERHHFVKIHRTSIISCTSPTGSYSELAFVLWVDGKDFSKYGYNSSNDKYRIIINLLFDSQEDLWCVSASLIKRSSWGTRDEKEGHISNRLCDVTELRLEIKKMLLFLGISPREAYRQFRRNMEEKFIVTSSTCGINTVETESHFLLMKDLDKPNSSFSNNNFTRYDHHGYSYPMGSSGGGKDNSSNLNRHANGNSHSRMMPRP